MLSKVPVAFNVIGLPKHASAPLVIETLGCDEKLTVRLLITSLLHGAGDVPLRVKTTEPLDMSVALG